MLKNKTARTIVLCSIGAIAASYLYSAYQKKKAASAAPSVTSNFVSQGPMD